MAGKWHAFLTNKDEPKVAQYTASQPWGYPTRREALRVLRPQVQMQSRRAKEQADRYAAAVKAIDSMLEDAS